MEALGIQEHQEKKKFYVKSNTDLNINAVKYHESKNKQQKQNFYNENNQTLIVNDDELQNSFLKASNNANNNFLKKSKKYFKFLNKQQQQQQQQQNIIPLNRNQQSFDQINKFLFEEIQQKKQEDILNQSYKNLNNNEIVKQHIYSDSSSVNTLKNFHSRVRSRYKLFKEKLKISSSSVDSSIHHHQQFSNNSHPNFIIENKNNKVIMQNFIKNSNSKNVNNIVKINNLVPPPVNATMSTTNTSSIPLSGLYHFDDESNMRLYFNEDLNYPFVVNSDYRNKKQSISPHNRNRTSLERRLQSNEKYLQINALVNNKGLNEQQPYKSSVNQSPYFYKESSYSQSPPASKNRMKIMNNSKEDIFVNGNFISGKTYYQHISKNPNIFDFMNENTVDTQAMVHRFNTLNIPSIETESIKQAQLHIPTVYAQPLDDTYDYHNHSVPASTATSTATHSNKATKQLSKLLKHLKKKLKNSSKDEKISYSNEANFTVQNNLTNPNDVSMTSNNNTLQQTQKNKQTNLDTSLSSNVMNEDHTKKQNRDIITKLYKAYNKKFDKQKVNSKQKLPSTLVTEIFAPNYDNSNPYENNNHQHLDQQNPENIRKRIKAFRSDPNLYLNEAQLEASKFDAEMTSLLKATKEKFGNDVPITNKTTENNNYLNSKLYEVQTKPIKVNDPVLDPKYHVDEFYLNTTVQQQQRLNEIAQSYIKFQRSGQSDNESQRQTQQKQQPLYVQKQTYEQHEDLNYSQQQQHETNENTSDINRSKSFTNNLTPSSKKRVSFHEQVIKTDVESGNSTLVPILYTMKEKQYSYNSKRSLINEAELNNNSSFRLNNRTPAETRFGAQITNNNNEDFLSKADYTQALTNDNSNRKVEFININKSYVDSGAMYPSFNNYENRNIIDKPIEQHF